MISIKKTIEEKHENLLVVDSLNCAFRWKWKGAPYNFAANYVEMIKSLANSYKSSKIIMLGDWGSSWRKTFYPEYKANRALARDNQSEEDEEDFKEFLNELNNAILLLENEEIPFFRFKGVEADDVAGYIVNKYYNKMAHIWLISTDKDWDLLIRDNVSRFSYLKRMEITLNNWPYNCKPEQYIDLKILSGDAGDNVSKPDGIGAKRAETLLQEYESVWDMPLPIDSNLKYIQNLNKFAAAGGLERNDMLMNIPEYCEEAIGEDNLKEIDKILGEYL